MLYLEDTAKSHHHLCSRFSELSHVVLEYNLVPRTDSRALEQNVCRLTFTHCQLLKLHREKSSNTEGVNFLFKLLPGQSAFASNSFRDYVVWIKYKYEQDCQCSLPLNSSTVRNPGITFQQQQQYSNPEDNIEKKVTYIADILAD